MRSSCCGCEILFGDTCSECGGKQLLLLEAKRELLEAKRAEAEALLADLAFDEAIGLAHGVASESHTELADLAEWATAFVAAAMVKRDRQHSAATELEQHARKQLMATDYPAAIRAIEMIPEKLRGASASDLLATCRDRLEESDKLIAEIQGMVKCKEVVGLLDLVSQAVRLRGDRADLRELRDNLVELDLRRFSKARAALESGDTQAAIQALPACPQDTDECRPADQLRSWIELSAGLESELVALFRPSKSDGRFDVATITAILEIGEQCLYVNPHSKKANALVQHARGLLAKHAPALAQEHKRRLAKDARRQQERLTILSTPPIRSSIGIELRFLPGDSILPTNAAEGSITESGSTAPVQPFFMGIHQVTNAQWNRVMGNPPSTWQGSDHPVEQVTWHEANEFCTRLSQLPEEIAAGRVYRLPTAAEWDYACRAGTTTDLWLGYHFVWDEYAWFAQNADWRTHPVGQKKPNPWGFYDMLGNVHEWCSDSYRDSASDSDDMHVIKGGSIQFSQVGEDFCFRAQSASMRCFDTGLRLAMELS